MLELDEHMIATRQYQVDVVVGAATGIDTKHRVSKHRVLPCALNLGCGDVQPQHPLSFIQQVRQAHIQLTLAVIQLLHHDLVIADARVRGQHPSQLPTAAILLIREVTLHHAFTLSPNWHARHVDVDQLHALGVIA
jgi:hypothetical protein